MKITRPVTPDGMCGYDDHGQFVLSRREYEHSIVSSFGHNTLHDTCAICMRGWEATSASLLDQTHWPLVGGYVHESCLVRHFGLIERATFSHAMSKAKLAHEGFRVVANGYWGDRDPWGKKPWYEADLIDYAATIVLGWRKRVACIEVRVWPGSTASVKYATEVFAAEDVTKEFETDRALIHAWGDRKIEDYLIRFGEMLRAGWVERAL